MDVVTNYDCLDELDAAARRSAKLDRLVSEAGVLGVTGIRTSDFDFAPQAEAARQVRERVASGQSVDMLANKARTARVDPCT